MATTFTSIVGTFKQDSKGKITLSKTTTTSKTTKSKKQVQKTPKIDPKAIQPFLEYLKNKKFFKEFKDLNLKLTKQSIKDSINYDNLIIQTISTINELDKTANLLSKRLREWAALTLPEFEHSIGHHEKFAQLIKDKSRKELLKQLDIKESETMGSKFQEQDLRPIKLLATQVTNIYDLRHKQEAYLEDLMQEYCPNFLSIAGPTIGAKLFEQLKSLRKLALAPSSKIQLLGAEKALFRHLKTGARSPKYGIIFSHSLIQRAKPKNKGQVARTIAAYLSRALKVDFFKGEFIADKLKEQLEKKFPDKNK